MASSRSGLGKLHNNVPFKKLRLVDEDEMIRLIEKRLKDYNPALRARAHLRMQMNDTLHRSDLPSDEKLAIFKANQQKYRKIQQNQMGISEASGEGQASISTLPPPPPASSHDGDDDDAEQEEVHDDLDGNEEMEEETNVYATPAPNIRPEMKSNVPISSSTTLSSSSSTATTNPTTTTPKSETKSQQQQQHRSRVDAKYTRLMDLLSLPNSPIRIREQSGEIIIDDQLIPNSSYKDLISLLTNPEKRNSNQKGKQKFIAALISHFKKNAIRAPQLSQYISSSKVIDEMRDQVGRGRHIKGQFFPPGQKIQVLRLYR